MAGPEPSLTHALSDSEDRLVSADEPLAGLQRSCGGEIPGLIAVPTLLELVRKARVFGLKLARPVSAHDGHNIITTWVEIVPDAGGGCAISARNWRVEAVPPEVSAEAVDSAGAVNRELAEFTARLDARQAVLAVESEASDLAGLVESMRQGLGKPWTGFVTVESSEHQQPMHWRLLDGARVTVPGSHRAWRARLYPSPAGGGEPQGFELCLTTDEPLVPVRPEPSETVRLPNNTPGLVGRDIAPVLRQPIARIIANAETIRTRMAGPLAEEYAQYAADIATAAQHLLSLVDDMTDLEVVESEDFHTAPDRIDLADVARRAAGILGVRAVERGISIDAPKHGETMPAIAEFRRVLQVLLNLVGNAIRYAPDNSQVWIRLEGDGATSRVIVADQGPGISSEQQARVFEKFERLGRSDAQGSGLGLYISRRLARAMGGDLSVESAPGQGARFVLAVPADPLGARA